MIYRNGLLLAQTNDNTTGVGYELPLIIANSDFVDSPGEETPYYGEFDERSYASTYFLKGNFSK